MQKKILVPLVILAVVAALFSAGPVADMLDPARGMYKKLERHSRHSECDFAEEELHKILAQHPDSRYVSRAIDLAARCYWYSATDLFYNKGDYSSAIEKAELVIDRYRESNYASEAREDLPFWYREWGEDFIKAGDYEAAIEKLQAVLDKYPEYEHMGTVVDRIMDLLLETAAKFRLNGEYEKAIAVCDRAITDYPEAWKLDTAVDETVSCYYDWGVQLQGEERFEEAVEKYTEIIEGYPNVWLVDTEEYSHDLAKEASASCYYEWATSLKAGGNYEEAVERYCVIVEELPQTSYGDPAREELASCYYEWATSLREGDNYEEALEKFLVIVDEFPGTSCEEDAANAVPETCYGWASSLENEARYFEALEKYLLIIKKYSRYPYPIDYRSDAEEAVPRVHLSWAISLEGQERYEEAIEKYGLIIEEYSGYPYPEEHASEAEKRVPGCYHGWALALIEEGRFEEGLHQYSMVLEGYPYSGWASEENSTLLKDIPVDVLFDSAAQYKEAEKYNTAIMLYKSVAKYHPDSVYAYDAANLAITTEIEKIYKDQHGILPQPYEAAKKKLGGKCEVEIINDTPYELTILISGPTNMSITIKASPGSTIRILPPFSWQQPPVEAERQTITILPGHYRVAAKVKEPGILPFYGEWSLTSDNSYLSWFFLIRTYG